MTDNTRFGERYRGAGTQTPVEEHTMVQLLRKAIWHFHCSSTLENIHPLNIMHMSNQQMSTKVLLTAWFVIDKNWKLRLSTWINKWGCTAHDTGNEQTATTYYDMGELWNLIVSEASAYMIPFMWSWKTGKAPEELPLGRRSGEKGGVDD